MISRRRFTQLSAMAAGAVLTPDHAFAAPTPPPTKADIALEIAPFTFEPSPKHRIRTFAYNNQVPGPLLRLRQGRPTTVSIRNATDHPEIVHWHGLFLPSDIDGASEEGTPMIAPGASTHFTLTPNPAGFRWYHTHIFAGNDLSRGLYSGLHGPLFIDPPHDPTSAASAYDAEVFLDLHDWDGQFLASADGNMAPAYSVSTINGKMLGFGEPIRVRQGQRLLLHVLNSSATDVHWLALAGHTLRVIALDGNPVATPQSVPMLRIAPAERVCAIVELNNPGTWILGEVRKHIQAAGMGIVLEYANSTTKPTWTQPEDLLWNYQQFAAPQNSNAPTTNAHPIELIFDAKFLGHGAEEQWRINGKSYPHTEQPILTAGQRYRLIMKNHSADNHPIHLHRHTFELCRVDGSPELRGIFKDVVLAPSNLTTEVEFTANNPGLTLFHCHQQDHMDRGFMMVFRYA
ncbi:MAG: multicopper oxidase family protein [Acidobacteriaceae bacterium]